MPIYVIWLAYRLLTSFWAFLLSLTRPFTELEKSLPLWPSSPNFGAWMERVWLLPWQRWDAGWYLKIVTSGYRADDGTAQFHPLFAWLAIPLTRLGIDPLLSLLLISLIAGILMLYLFEKLTCLDLDSKTAKIATILLISFPTAFILFAPYTESLFLLCAVGCIYFMRSRKWVLAGLLGGLAALTKQQGIFLVFLMAWELWENSGWNVKLAIKNLRDWLAVIGPAIGLSVWFLYRALVLNYFKVEAGNLKTLIYSGLISSSAVKVVPVYQFTWPWQALWLAFGHCKSPDIDILIDLGLGAVFVVMLVFSWQLIRLSYRIYAAVISLSSFSYYTGPIHPYMGLPRHLFLAFPVFIGLAPTLSQQKRWLVALTGGTLGMLFLISGYVLNG
jgi:hypothetical protein